MAQQRKPAIHVRGLKKSYGKLCVLRGVRLSRIGKRKEGKE